jgi:predicted metal-dependent HD superfamily phosphohydrolase
MSPPLTLDQLPHELVREAKAAYEHPPRAYHSFAHVEDVLRHLAGVATEGLGWHQPLEILLAALFHDAVYVAGRQDNETRSADLALESIARHLPGQAIDKARLRQLIELTARHGQLHRDELDEESRLFLDADMAILGADLETFDAYDAAIAQEYRAIPQFLYRRNRRRFLQHLLDADRIYHSDHFKSRLDAPARANLRRVLGQNT